MPATPAQVRKILANIGFRERGAWRSGYSLVDMDDQISVTAQSIRDARCMKEALEQQGFAVHLAGLTLIAERD